MKHVGSLIISTEADAKKYAAVTEVTGYLYINSSAKLDAPALTSVGGYLSINSSAKLDALTSVGGYLSIYSSAKLDAPALYAKGFSNFQVYDGIPCAVISEKQQDGAAVMFCRRAQIKNQKIIGDKFYVARRGNYSAHGQTIAEAVQELAFKTGTRDVYQYRDMVPSTRKTPHEWAVIYRTITGACQFGVKDFMQRKGKLKKAYTLAEILRETEGAYGHAEFKNVVTK